MTAAIILDYILIVSSFIIVTICFGFMFSIVIGTATFRYMSLWRRAIMPILTAMAIPSAAYLIFNPVFDSVLAIACGIYLFLYIALWYIVAYQVFMEYDYEPERRILIGLAAFFLPVSILYLLVSFGIIL